MNDIRIVPCDFRLPTPSSDGSCYIVKMYFLIECDTLCTYSFLRRAEALYNSHELISQGVSNQVFTKEIQVSKYNFPVVYQKILDYVSSSCHD